MNDRQLVFKSLGQALHALDSLVQAQALPPGTEWSWAQTLEHCAQSIEYSMTGFPQARSAIFQRTVGAAAISVFSWRGRMNHSLAEPIPGAPVLQANSDVAQAEARLRHAVRTFQQWTAPLKPHFAYGDLGKSAFDQAHAMHIANHFSAFTSPSLKT